MIISKDEEACTMPILSFGPISVVAAVQKEVMLSDKLSEAEKVKIIDWSQDSYGSVWEQLSDLLEVSPPPELLQCWEIFLEIIKLVG